MDSVRYNIDKILDFIQENLKYKDRELLKKYVEDHYKYRTFDYAIDMGGNVVGIVRYNISDDHTVAHVLDFAIKQSFRGRGIGKDFIFRAVKIFPKLNRLEFKRGIRGEDRIRSININKIFSKNIF